MKKASSFKMKNSSIAKLAKKAGKPSVLKFDITKSDERRYKRKVRFLVNEQARKYKKLYRRAKRGDVRGIIKDKIKSIKNLFN